MAQATALILDSTIASFSLPRSNSVAFGLKQTLGRIL
jgi:hypothetical protein